MYANVYNVLVYNLNLTLIVQCKLTNLRKREKKFEGELTALERLKGVFIEPHKPQKPHQAPHKMAYPHCTMQHPLYILIYIYIYIKYIINSLITLV